MKDNPKLRQQFILDELIKEPTLNYVQMFTIFSQAFTKTQRTFNNDWNKATETFKSYRSKVIKAKEESSIKLEVKAHERGLKTKFDRAFFYQEQIVLMEKQLSGAEKFTFIVGNKPLSSHDKSGNFMLPIEKQNEIRKAIKEYQTEISKIEGDYAAIKNDTKLEVKEYEDWNDEQLIKELNRLDKK